MALGPIHCGSFLLLAATVLLVVASISAPVVDHISFLNIYNGGQESTFGVFGYCTNVQSGTCSPRGLGYDIATASNAMTNYTYVNNSLTNLTKALVLHPVAAGIAFLSFLIALCSDHVGFLFASLIAFVAFLVSLVAMIIDFVMFGIIRHEINSNTSASASFSTAIWLTLAATVVLFFASFIVCFECFGSRRRNRDQQYVGNGYASSGPWWRRNNKY
ncbi:hypothetical protein JCM24511_02209 [Saitozyma sp. JCM 24511]|nr:hypothetical protein JCM24511_02209 [Saitozyma sp. JCM 24511]